MIKNNSIFSSFKTDSLSGLVVFLVALPLCLGIAVASGASPFAVIIIGVIGGLVVGHLSGSSMVLEPEKELEQNTLDYQCPVLSQGLSFNSGDSARAIIAKRSFRVDFSWFSQQYFTSSRSVKSSSEGKFPKFHSLNCKHKNLKN